MFLAKAPRKKYKAKNSYKSPRHFLTIESTTLADKILQDKRGKD